MDRAQESSTHNSLLALNNKLALVAEKTVIKAMTILLMITNKSCEAVQLTRKWWGNPVEIRETAWILRVNYAAKSEKLYHNNDN